MPNGATFPSSNGPFRRCARSARLRPQVIGDCACGAEKQLSRLLQVADGVPHEVARAIGPAPKAGRERWMAIGTLLERQEARARAQDEIASPRFRAVIQDQRFQLVSIVCRRSDKPEPEKPEELKDAQAGSSLGLKRDGKAPRIEFLPGTIRPSLQEAVSMLAKVACLPSSRTRRLTRHGGAHGARPIEKPRRVSDINRP